MQRLFPGFLDGAPAVGLLFLRVFCGMGMMMHGWGKIQNPFGWMNKPDAPSQVPSIIQALGAVGEFGGGLALVLGLLTPIAGFGVMCTMFVAVLSHLGRGDGFIRGWELAGIYFITSLTLVLTGPGAVSLDRLLFGRKASVADDRLPTSDSEVT